MTMITVMGNGKIGFNGSFRTTNSSYCLTLYKLKGEYKTGDYQNEEYNINNIDNNHLVFNSIESLDVFINVLNGARSEYLRKLREEEQCQLPMDGLKTMKQEDVQDATNLRI